MACLPARNIYIDPHMYVQMPELLGFQKSNKLVVLFAVVCPPGSHFQNDECIPCPIGYYQYQTGRSSCIKCPVGKTTNSYGAFSAEHCKLNSFFSLMLCILSSNN